MSNDTAVYDLGVVDSAPSPDDRDPTGVSTRVRRKAAPAAPAPVRRPLEAIADSLELFAPGGGHLLRARWSDGLFVMSATGLLVALAWAIFATLERLPDSLSALGLPAHGAIYFLAGLYVCLAVLHAGNVLYGTSRGSSRVHPAAAGFASAIFPGWGQLLNSQPTKAASFVVAVWIVGVLWLLTSPWSAPWLEAQGVGLREGLGALSSPAVLWTVPAVLWALSVYDAVASSSH